MSVWEMSSKVLQIGNRIEGEKMMKRSRFSKVCSAFLIAALAIPAAVMAADLYPPDGPIGPTGRFGPRTEISDIRTPGEAESLFKITQPGSYYMPRNITGIAGKGGIEIVADDVTLDLNGFALIGVGGSGSGVFYAPGVKNLTVRNGTIRDWGNFGIGPQDNANPPPIPTNGQFEELQVSGNGNHGLFVGENSRVINCGAVNNGADGFTIGRGSVVTNCTAQNNAHNGFVTGESCVVVNCTAVDNQGFSFSDGFDVEAGSVLEGCAARGNSGNGIKGRPPVMIAGCTSVSNTLFGINAPNSLIRGNLVADNGAGGCDATDATLIDNHGCP